MIAEFIIALIASFAVTAVFARIIIPVLKSKKMGQYIKDIGPRWHKSKEGTPTMGGITFISSMILVCAVALLIRPAMALPVVLIMALGIMNALIGFVDDYQKLIKKNNDGLGEWQKLILQTLAGGIYLFLMRIFNFIDTKLEIPFADVEVELGVFYYVIALALIVGMTNSTNMTDGIDGLASSVTFVVGAFFAVAAFAIPMVPNRAVSLVSATLIGGMIGFLVYNFNPARVFMGDTGSLYIGGIITGLAFALNEPLVVVICGLVYVLEFASSFLQRYVYILSGRKKRLFKMAPIHHHFEQCGWSENKIVAVFSALTLLCCIGAWFAF